MSALAPQERSPPAATTRAAAGMARHDAPPAHPRGTLARVPVPAPPAEVRQTAALAAAAAPLPALARLWAVPLAALRALEDARAAAGMDANATAAATQQACDWVQFYHNVVAADSPCRRADPHDPETRLFKVLAQIDLAYAAAAASSAAEAAEEENTSAAATAEAAASQLQQHHHRQQRHAKSITAPMADPTPTTPRNGAGDPESSLRRRSNPGRGRHDLHRHESPFFDNEWSACTSVPADTPSQFDYLDTIPFAFFSTPSSYTTSSSLFSSSSSSSSPSSSASSSSSLSSSSSTLSATSQRNALGDNPSAHLNATPRKPRPATTISRRALCAVLSRSLFGPTSPSALSGADTRVALAVAMFPLDPDKHRARFPLSVLRSVSLSAALRRLEHNGDLVGCLAPLDRKHFSPLLRDLAAVIEDSSRREGPHYAASKGSDAVQLSDADGKRKHPADDNVLDLADPVISKGALLRYCRQRDLLTRRSIHSLFSRHGSRVKLSARRARGAVDIFPGAHADGATEHMPASPASPMSSSFASSMGIISGHDRQQQGEYLMTRGPGASPTIKAEVLLSVSSSSSVTMLPMEKPLEVLSASDFARLYLALVHCATDAGLRYWFRVLDVDGDDRVGLHDAVHFYEERRRDAERSSAGVVLCGARTVWGRVCAAAAGGVGGYGVGCGGGGGGGLSMRAALSLPKAEREFFLCALLIRRADDGQLVDQSATEQLRRRRRQQEQEQEQREQLDLHLQQEHEEVAGAMDVVVVVHGGSSAVAASTKTSTGGPPPGRVVSSSSSSSSLSSSSRSATRMMMVVMQGSGLETEAMDNPPTA